VAVAGFPDEVPSRIQYGPRLRALVVYLVEQQLVPYARVRELLADLFGQSLSVGTLVTMVQQCAHALAPVEDVLKAEAQAASVLHQDETSVRVAGKLQWVHVSSTATLTHYGVHPKRGREATDAIGILPRFHGVSVHDGWKPYRTYTQCRHALCNVHHLRELTFVAEELHQSWAGKLKALLHEMKAAVATAQDSGLTSLPVLPRRHLQTRYEAVLLAGLAANPPPPPPPPAAESGGGASSRQRATCSNGSGSTRRRCSPSWTTSPFPSITTRPSKIYACSRSNKRCRAVSVPMRAPRPTAGSAASSRRSASSARPCCTPSRPPSPVVLSFRPWAKQSRFTLTALAMRSRAHEPATRTLIAGLKDSY
jgi:hypothetical protein